MRRSMLGAWHFGNAEASNSMRRMRWAAAVAFGALAAIGQSAAAELKIAVVDTAQAIQQSAEATAFAKKLEQQLQPQSDKLKKLQEEIEALEKKIADEGDVMSDADKRTVVNDIEGKRIDLDFGAKKFQKELQNRQNELLQEMLPKVDVIVKDLVDIERYDLVFERRNVGYVNPRHDITAKVTEKLNERYAAEDDS